MKASNNFKLMMLSSTINTLIGGTAPFNNPAGKEGWSFIFLLFFDLVPGLGDETLGGGVEVRWIVVASAVGGVGKGGAAGGAFDFSEALE